MSVFMKYNLIIPHPTNPPHHKENLYSELERKLHSECVNKIIIKRNHPQGNMYEETFEFAVPDISARLSAVNELGLVYFVTEDTQVHDILYAVYSSYPNQTPMDSFSAMRISAASFGLDYRIQPEKEYYTQNKMTEIADHAGYKLGYSTIRIKTRRIYECLTIKITKLLSRKPTKQKKMH